MGHEPAGLDAWLSRELGEGGPRSGESGMDDSAHPDAAFVTAQRVVAAFVRLPTASLARRLARWLREHVAGVIAGGMPAAWQWRVVLLAWTMEQAGICELYGSDPDCAANLVAEAGFNAAALRQLPFRGWREGRAGCLPGVTFPGMRAGRPQHFGRAQRSLTPEAEDALGALVDAAVRAGSAAMDLGAPADGPSCDLPCAEVHVARLPANEPDQGPDVSTALLAGNVVQPMEEQSATSARSAWGRSARQANGMQRHGPYAMGGAGAAARPSTGQRFAGADEGRCGDVARPAGDGATLGAWASGGTATSAAQEGRAGV